MLDRLNILKNYINEHNLSLYVKKGSPYIKKSVDIWDCNNTVSIIVYSNNSIKIFGEESLLLNALISLLK